MCLQKNSSMNGFVVQIFLYFQSSYDTARGMIDSIFGPKVHKDFPKNRRLKGSGCNSGFYPSSLPYKHEGLDLLAESGDQVITEIEYCLSKTFPPPSYFKPG